MGPAFLRLFCGLVKWPSDVFGGGQVPRGGGPHWQDSFANKTRRGKKKNQFFARGIQGGGGACVKNREFIFSGVSVLSKNGENYHRIGAQAKNIGNGLTHKDSPKQGPRA